MTAPDRPPTSTRDAVVQALAALVAEVHGSRHVKLGLEADRILAIADVDSRIWAARALHTLDPDLSAGPRCKVCVYEPWPCATARVLDGETS